MSPAVEQLLASMDTKALASLVLELASCSPEAMRSLELRAAPVDIPLLRPLVAAVDAALASVDLEYHDEFDWVEDAHDGVQGVEDMVDELERHLDAGAREVVRQVLEHLLVRLHTLASEADNADALVGVAEQASALFARAVEGHPDPVTLARWVVAFRTESGGWPAVHLDAVAHVFDEPAWAAYRAGVAALGDDAHSADPYRNEVDLMLLELADHDGDVDRAVALLAAGERPYYREVIRRLSAAGQTAEVLDWLDRAVAQGCVDDAWRAGPTIVPAEEAARAYLAGGRPDAALSVARMLFSRDLSVGAYRLLCEVAERCDRLDEQRAWAFEHANARAASVGGAHLVRLHLAGEDVASAWQAADAYGPGHAWRELVDASETAFPLQAARMCLSQVLASLTKPDSKRYPSIVDLIVKARDLYIKAGHASEASAEIRRLREAYRRRPALMAAMNRARLPA